MLTYHFILAKYRRKLNKNVIQFKNKHSIGKRYNVYIGKSYNID